MLKGCTTESSVTFLGSRKTIVMLIVGIAVRHHHEDIPGSQDMFDYGFFDTRFYKSVQLYETEKPDPSESK